MEEFEKDPKQGQPSEEGSAQATPETRATGDDAKEFKLYALLAYLGVLVLVPLFLKKDSAYVQFHAKQGLILLIGWGISWLPFGWLLGILAFVLSVLGVINVLSEKQAELPLIGDLAKKINL